MLSPKPRSFQNTIAPRIKSLIQELPLQLHKQQVFFVPIGLYLRGLHFQKSQWDMSFYVSLFVHPLYAMPWANYSQFGRRVPIPGPGYNQGWSCDRENFDLEFTTLLNETLKPRMDGLINGEALIRYTDILADEGQSLGFRRDPDWPSSSYGWAALHMGRLEEARANFEANLKKLALFPPLPSGEPMDDTPEAANMRVVIDLIARNPDAIPAHCDAVARQAIANLKMTNVWEPTPFQYTG